MRRALLVSVAAGALGAALVIAVAYGAHWIGLL
jgi:hypothetical protein